MQILNDENWIEEKNRRGINEGTMTRNDDPINHPQHYQQGSKEVIDIIQDAVTHAKGPFEAYCISNIIKYILRYPYKGKTISDLEKAKWFLNKLITLEKEVENGSTI